MQASRMVGGAAAAALLAMMSAVTALAEEAKSGLDQAALEAVYAQAIRDAAVKRPSFRRTLTPVDAQLREITVITLTTPGQDAVAMDDPLRRRKGRLVLDRNPDATGVVRAPVWVSLTDELRQVCRGVERPVLALQQILGMPPEGGTWEMVEFRVAPAHIFRPCASGPDITTTECSFDLPTAPDAAVKETQLFVFGQMWTSYVEGFPVPGFPFTAMGWTYDWNPDSKDHYGVSEYVVKEDAPVADIRVLTPAAFCGG